jgi:hypothetical protein
VRQFSIADILELAEADMAGVGLAPRRSDAADVIYINAGVTRPVVSWLERSTDGGRLNLPITANQGFMADDPTNATSGAVFQIERRTSQFSLQCISPVRIIPCDGARNEKSETAFAEAFKKGDCKRVTRFYRIMMMYPTTVVGFVARDGASPTIDGVDGRQDRLYLCSGA